MTYNVLSGTLSLYTTTTTTTTTTTRIILYQCQKNSCTVIRSRKFIYHNQNFNT